LTFNASLITIVNAIISVIIDVYVCLSPSPSQNATLQHTLNDFSLAWKQQENMNLYSIQNTFINFLFKI